MPSNSIGQIGPYSFDTWRMLFETHQPEFEPSAAPSPVQQTLPTSAYGQTIPVIWGKARVPGAYIWVKPYDAVITEATLSQDLTARLRFARPLEADSNWRLRRLWAAGTLVADNSTGYRASRITYLKDYDGGSTQGRDPLMVAEEGEANVSAHRGYLDIVITFQLGGDLTQPPGFDAEWVQDPETGVEVEEFISFSSDVVNTMPAVSFASNRMYGCTESGDDALLRHYSIGLLHEVYSVAVGAGVVRPYIHYNEKSFRYLPAFDRLLMICYTPPADPDGYYPILVHPMTGAIVAESDAHLGTAGQLPNTDGYVQIGNVGILAHSSFSLEYFTVFRITATSIVRTYNSGSGWGGRGIADCIAPGEIRASDADLWVCAGDTLYKVVVNSTGAVLSITAHATFADDLRYAVYYGGDVVVWTDGADVIKVDGTTGSTIWTESTPYTIATAYLRALTPPDVNRLDDELYLQGSTFYYFTSMIDGSTRSISKATETLEGRHVFDAYRNIVVNTDNLDYAKRRVFDMVGDGTTRDLEDFVAAVWESDEDFSAAEHDEVGITDQIQGAVIDVTTGKREVVRRVASPYSFSIFERAATIISKRALTDGSFALDATLSAADFADRGGQAIKAKRINPEEFIARIGLTYRDPDEIYQPRTQYGEIQFTPFPLSPTDISTRLDIPVIHDADSMKTLATVKVHRLAEEKHEFSFTLRARYGDLEPEDIIQFDYAGRTIVARVVDTTLNPDFTIDVSATEFLSKTAATVTGATGRPVEPGAAGSPESIYYHLDIPLHSEADDLASEGFVQYHVLTSQGQEAWDGVTLYSKPAASGTYTPVSTQTEDGLVGIALTALPDTDDPEETELAQTIDVTFISGDTSQLATVTEEEALAGANKFAIGAPGRWEVCHVIDIEDNGGTFTFTGLVRGRGVSEEHTGDHEAGDFVVWLSGDNVQHVDYALADLNDSFAYKAVGYGGNITTTTAVTHTMPGEAEKIPKPSDLAAAIDGSDIDLSWVRRSRFAAVLDVDDVLTLPLGETLEQYVIRIKDGPGGTVLRTVTVDDATTYTYTAANITTDFGSMPEALTWDIRQVSGTGVICPTREVTQYFNAGDPNDFVADDGATFPMYSAVQSPAFYNSGLDMTFVSWEAWTGVRSAQYTSLDHSTGYFTGIEGMGSSSLVDDDHGNPVIVLDHEDYLHAFYGAHGSAVPTGMNHSVTRWEIGGTELAGSHWSIEPKIAGLYTYPHPVMVSSVMYLFMRKTATSEPLVVYATTGLSGGVATWGSEKTIVDFGTTNRAYMGPAVVVGTKIHFVATMADSGDTIRTDVYYFVYDTVNGDIENHDNSFSVASGSLPVGLTDANTNYRLYAHPGGNGGTTPYLAFDTSGDPFVMFSDGSASSYDIKVKKRSAGTWGASEAVGVTDHRFNGFALGQLPAGVMEAFYEDDTAAVWTRGGDMMRKERSAGGTWGTAETILPATTFALGQPNIVRDAHIDARVTFTEHRQDSLDATAGGLRIYLWGDGGLVLYAATPATVITTTADGFELREPGDKELREDSDDELREVPV